MTKTIVTAATSALLFFTSAYSAMGADNTKTKYVDCRYSDDLLKLSEKLITALPKDAEYNLKVLSSAQSVKEPFNPLETATAYLIEGTNEIFYIVMWIEESKICIIADSLLSSNYGDAVTFVDIRKKIKNLTPQTMPQNINK